MAMEKPVCIMFEQRKLNPRKVHIYASGETYVKDQYSTLGRYSFKSASDAKQYYSDLGYRTN